MGVRDFETEKPTQLTPIGQREPIPAPLRVTQRTPSFRATPKKKAGLGAGPLLGVAILLFGGSVALGWVTSRAIWRPAAGSAQAAGAGADHPR